jgi:hypothetical protein
VLIQGHLEPLRTSHDWGRQAATAGGETRWVAATTDVIKQATEEYKAERAASRS